MRELPSKAEIDEAVAYDPITGAFTWKRRTNARRSGFNSKYAGQPAGTLSLGYLTIRIKGRLYGAHRLAVVIMTGKWPQNEVDHRNLIKSDNRWENLREATHQQNAQNTVGRSKKGLPKGVSTSRGRFTASIKSPAGCVEYLGIFDTVDEAHGAYKSAAVKHFGEFANY